MNDSRHSVTRRSAISVSTKIAILTAGIAVITGLVFAIYHRSFVIELSEERELQALAHDTKLVAHHLQTSIQSLEEDLLAVLRTPPIEGILRATRNRGVDPLDGSSLQLWKTRLETIFESLLRARSNFEQLRYIGVEDDGRELVRVHRVDGTPFRVPTPDLQQKGNEPYFHAAMTLPAGQIRFGTVTPNREFGAVTEDARPMLRVFTPIHDREGNPFGMVIFNEDYESLLERTMAEMHASRDFVVLDSDGNAFAYDADEGAFEFRYAEDVPASSDIREIRDSRSASGWVELTGNRIARVVDFPMSKSPSSSQQMRFAKIADREALDAAVAAGTRNDLWLTVLILVLATGIGWFAGSRLAGPIRMTIRSVRRYGATGDVTELPVERGDEIGEFARAFRDVSESLDASQRSEREAYKRLKATIENSIDGQITIDETRRILSYNSACERLFGYTRDEALGMEIERLLFDEDGSNQGSLLESASARLPVGSVREVKARHRDGSAIPLEISVSRVRLPGRVLFSAVLRDITIRKKIESDRERLLGEVMASNKNLDEFAYIASHDMREPLRAIHNHARFLAEDHADALGDDGIKRLDRLTYLTRRLDRILQDLLYFSRLGRESEAFRPTDLNALVETVREDLEDHLEDTNSTVEILGTLPTAHCDPVRIAELFRNLITNAIKYNDSGSPRVEIGTESGGIYFVRDNGIGIPEEFHDQIFRIFKRLHPERKYGEGTGAGLTFVKRIVERHQGEIWVESRSGSGATFKFTLHGGTDTNGPSGEPQETVHTDRRR